MDLRLRFGETTRKVRVTRQGDGLAIRLDDGAEAIVSARRLADGTWRLTVQDPDGSTRVLQAAGHADRTLRQVWLDGRTWAYDRVEDHARRADTAGGLSATIPAVVLEVLVAPGDIVAEGDKLLLLESMKMVMPIVAPHAGTVSAVHCQAGDSVAPGTALVELAAAVEPSAP